MLRAIDVAKYQGVISWGQVATDSSLDAVGVQVTFGGAGVEQYGADNWAGAKAAGKKRIAYHFAYCAGPNNTDDAVAQARHFWSTVAGYGFEPGDQLAVDVEEASGPCSAAWAAAFCDELRRLSGVLPGFYSDSNYIATVLGGGVGLGAHCWLWLANYQRNLPPCPPGWSEITLWQNSSSGSEPGVAGEVDTDVEVAGFPSPPSPLSPVDLILGVDMTVARDDTDAKRAAIRLLYLNILRREPESVEKQNEWVAFLEANGLDATIAAIADSPEGQRELHLSQQNG